MRTDITLYALPADRHSEELRAMLSWHEFAEVSGQTAAAHQELRFWGRTAPAVIIRRDGVPWVIASGPHAVRVLGDALATIGRGEAA